MQRNNKELTGAQLVSLTSLREEEFIVLLSTFHSVWQQQHQYKDLKGAYRKIPKQKEHASMSLKGSYAKLLFVMMYLKENLTQHMLAYNFEISQGKVSQWLKLLLPVLEKALDQLNVLPSRCSEHLYATLQIVAGYIVVSDGTERPVPRSVDYQVQQEHYSGKKKRHMVKNNLLVNLDKEVLYLSETVEGNVHDKALMDEMDLSFPVGGVLLQDLGFQGYAPEGVEIIMPFKKPKAGELTPEQKQSNKEISSERVVVEHVIGSIKRLRCVADKIRLRIEGIRDLVMLIATGLHNFRVRHRNLS